MKTIIYSLTQPNAQNNFLSVTLCHRTENLQTLLAPDVNKVAACPPPLSHSLAGWKLYPTFLSNQVKRIWYDCT